jgi:hypothetical protein
MVSTASNPTSSHSQSLGLSQAPLAILSGGVMGLLAWAAGMH